MTIAANVQRADIFTAVRAFILGVISCEVVQGLDNGVPMPIGSFIAITPLYAARLSTNIDSYVDPFNSSTFDSTYSTQISGIGSSKVENHIQYTIQIDCYGATSSDWANVITTLWRDDYGVQAMAPNITPLHADDEKMMPIVDGEANFEERWMITAHLQYNPVVKVPIQFFDKAAASQINVNVTYP